MGVKGLKKHIHIIQLTFAEAELPLGDDLRLRQYVRVHLQTGDPPAKHARVARTLTHDRGIIGRQSEPELPDEFPSDFDAVEPQRRDARAAVVRGSDVVPGTWSDSTAGNRGNGSPPARHEAHKQLVDFRHPHVDTPALRVVVKDRPWALWVHPRNDGDGVSGVQATVVGNQYVAAPPGEVVRPLGVVGGATYQGDAHQFGRRIFVLAHVHGRGSAGQRIQRHRSTAQDN